MSFIPRLSKTTSIVLLVVLIFPVSAQLSLINPPTEPFPNRSAAQLPPSAAVELPPVSTTQHSPRALVPLQPENEGSSIFFNDLRRFEIVTFGTIPFTLLFANLGFTLGRYLYYGFAEGFTSINAQRNQPGILANQSNTSDEKAGVLIAAISGSLILAIIDLIVEKTKSEDERQ